MSIKMTKGEIVRVGDVIIELRSDGESSARFTVTAPRDIPIVREREIASPFHKKGASDIG